ncbi:MAG: isoprenylcysteine carboxylmethyltransferase family protein [Chloroflexi bacterium]|nr:isoprenylcysteine carboxylmethyltransferase family protein [Chloroflexota bacterium]
MNKFLRLFFLIVGNALALTLSLLALESTATNFLGWFLLGVGIFYGAGGVIYLWWDRGQTGSIRTEAGNRSFWWIIPGFAAAFFAPVLEYQFLPAFLPRALELEMAGLIIILAGLIVRVWSRAALKNQYSGYLRIKTGHKLVTEGPYRFVRHPGYSGLLLIALGISIGYSSIIGLLVIPLMLFPALAYRINIEEKLLTDEFGDRYRAYARSTKRLIPILW